MAMEKLWAKKLENGDKKWAEVPESRREDVEAVLKEDVEAGKITAQKYKEITGAKYE